LKESLKGEVLDALSGSLIGLGGVFLSLSGVDGWTAKFLGGLLILTSFVVFYRLGARREGFSV